MAWTQFQSTTNPTGVELDANLAALARMGVFPCTTGGTANAIVLTLADTNAPPLNAYQNYQEFGFIAAATNNGGVTLKVGSLAALTVYKDIPSGPNVLGSSEIVQNCAYIAMFDQALNGGVGGFHIRGSAMIANAPINPGILQVNGGASVTSFLSGTYTVAYTVVPANSTQDQNVSLTNVLTGDIVSLGLPASVASGLMFQGRVPASGTVSLRAANVTAASIAAFTLTGVHVFTTRSSP